MKLQGLVRKVEFLFLSSSDLLVIIYRCILQLDLHRRHLPYLGYNMAYEGLVHIRLDRTLDLPVLRIELHARLHSLVAVCGEGLLEEDVLSGGDCLFRPF